MYVLLMYLYMTLQLGDGAGMVVNSRVRSETWLVTGGLLVARARSSHVLPAVPSQHRVVHSKIS